MRGIHLHFFLFFLIISCHEKQNKTESHEKQPSIDSMPPTVNLPAQAHDDRVIYIERTRISLRHYSISVMTRFTIPSKLDYDSSYYYEGQFVFIHDNNSNTTDSLKLETDYYDPSDLELEDFTDSLHFKNFLFAVNWRGDSDQLGSEFFEFDGKRLKDIFYVDNLISLERKDKWTLSGFVAGRDEVVSNGQVDYLLTISLKDYKVEVADPDKQSIGYSTVALENFKAYRDPKLSEQSKFVVSKGKKLKVDSIFRSLKLVRLVIADSIVLYGRPDNISKHVEHNNAG